MKRAGFHVNYALALLMAGALAANPLIANRAAWAAHEGKGESKGKGHGHDRDEESERGRGETKGKGHARERDEGPDRGPKRHGAADAGHFSDRHRIVVRDYYVGQFHAGHCPPGLDQEAQRLHAPRSGEKMAHRPAAAAQRDFLRSAAGPGCRARPTAARLSLRARGGRYPADRHRHGNGNRRDSGSGSDVAKPNPCEVIDRQWICHEVAVHSCGVALNRRSKDIRIADNKRLDASAVSVKK